MLVEKYCPACGELIVGDKRVMSRKKFCSKICKSKYRTISGSRVDTHLWVNFRIREEEYNAILKSQGYRCAICKRGRDEFDKNFAVDHDHSCCSGKKSCGECVRGLLCQPCNNALGLLREDAEVVRAMSGYLAKFS